MSLSAEQICEQLMQKFSLTTEDADTYLNEITNLMYLLVYVYNKG